MAGGSVAWWSESRRGGTGGGKQQQKPPPRERATTLANNFRLDDRLISSTGEAIIHLLASRCNPTLPTAFSITQISSRVSSVPPAAPIRPLPFTIPNSLHHHHVEV